MPSGLVERRQVADMQAQQQCAAALPLTIPPLALKPFGVSSSGHKRRPSQDDAGGEQRLLLRSRGATCCVR